MKKNITAYIIAALVLGSLVGLCIHTWVADPKALSAINAGFAILTNIFLRMIKMIIAPLVLSTLISGIARMGDAPRSAGSD